MTKLHVHELTGFKPDALATYLGALGVLRLLAEQKDPQVRGFWRDEHFVLVSELDWASIERFLLEDYAPTPILAPWNMESGFFSLKSPPAGTDGNAESDDDEDDDESEQAVGDSLLDRFASSEAARFALLRRAIEIAQAAIPTDLRNAEEAVRRAHDAVNERTAEERGEHDAALREVAATEEDLAQRKAAVEERKQVAKGTAKTAPERDALRAAEQQMKDSKEQQTLRKKTAKDLEKKLKAAEKKTKGDTTLKKAVADAKKHFKEIQGATKDRLVGNLRARWSPEGQQWVDAAIALDEKGEAGFTSIFGSGGNDGRMEFTKNLRLHLDLLFDIDTGAAKDNAASRLSAAILGRPTNLLVSRAVGQFFPGRAGGTNMGAGFSGGAAINPWEFVLMLEGAVALVAGMSRRGDIAKARVSSPFWVEGASAGFGSASEHEGNPRGEQWLPLWSRPLCYRELVELIREGRAQVGRRQTTRAGDLVRATARLGLARGVDSLQRFAYLQRNGQSNLAVSTGRFYVTSRSHQALLDEVAPWIDRLGWYARRTKDNNVPLSLGVVARRTQEALFTVCRHEATPREWRELLVMLGAAELALARSGKNPARRPLPRLSGGWIAAVDDGTPRGRTSLRLALALASQHRPAAQVGALPTDSVRKHFIPVDAGNQQRPRFKLDDRGRVIRDPDNVCVGRDLVTDAIALVERRSVWARAAATFERAPQLPLEATPGYEAALEEVAAWLRRDVQDRGVLELVRPLLALDWREVGRTGPAVHPDLRAVADPLHMLFRLAHLPFDVPVRGSDGSAEARVPVRLDPEPLRRLAGGDLEGALNVASRRLEASGLRPVFRRGVATPALARRLAASLAFPISRNDAARAARLICKPYEVKHAEEPSSTEF